MDYEKKYNEALALAKDVKNGPSPHDSSVATVEYIFPEFRESEDERIWKALINGVRQIRCKNGITQEQMITYLEKQKPAEWNDTDMKEARANLISVCMDWEHGKQTTLLPVVAVRARYFLEHLTNPKSAEWSEEDEKKIRFLEKLIEYNVPEGVFSKGDGCKDGFVTKPEAIDMLKSLRPKPHKEIYQSAKHDLAIKFMNYLDENRPEGKMSLSNAECEDIDKAFKENDWAKIIRYIKKYRPLWESCEEQMKKFNKED